MGRLGTERPKFYVCWLRCNLGVTIPICSMYGIFTYIWVIFRANVDKYSIHGAYGIYWSSWHKWRVKLFAVPGYKRKDPARTSLWRTSFTNFANLLPWRSYIQQVPERMKWCTLDSPNAGCHGYIIFLVKWILYSFSTSRDFLSDQNSLCHGLPQLQLPWFLAKGGTSLQEGKQTYVDLFWAQLWRLGWNGQSHFRKVVRIIVLTGQLRS